MHFTTDDLDLATLGDRPTAAVPRAWRAVQPRKKAHPGLIDPADTLGKSQHDVEVIRVQPRRRLLSVLLVPVHPPGNDAVQRGTLTALEWQNHDSKATSPLLAIFATLQPSASRGTVCRSHAIDRGDDIPQIAFRNAKVKGFLNLRMGVEGEKIEEALASLAQQGTPAPLSRWRLRVVGQFEFRERAPMGRKA